MKKKNSIAMKTALLTGLICISTAFISKAQTYSLNQILDSMDANNPGLQQFGLKTQSSNAMGKASHKWSAPTAGFGLSEFPYGSSTKRNSGMMPRKMLMLRLQQMFPNFKMQKKEEKYYQSFANQNKDDRASMKNLLFAKAKIAYYNAYIAEKKQSIVNEQQKQLQLLIQIAKGRLSYNKSKLPEIYKAQAKLSNLQSSRIKISSQVKQATAILNSLMNRDVNNPLQIDTSEDLTKEQISILQIDSTYLFQHRSDILHTKHQINSLRVKQNMISDNAKPVFGVSWDNMRMNSGHYMYSAMATMSIPIAPWFSKGYKSKVEAIDYQIQSMQKMKENQVSEALGNIRKDWLNLHSTKKELQILQQEVIPAYEKTYQSYLNAFSENNGNIYETLSAWNDLTQKKMEYYDKVSEVLNIRVLLETEIQDKR